MRGGRHISRAGINRATGNRRGGCIVRSYNGCGSDRADRPGEWIDVSFAVRVQPVREENDKQVEVRVNPHRRAGETSVAEGSVAKQFAAVGRVAAAVIP